MTYGVVDEVRDNGLHELLVAPVADESDEHLKQLTHQALKVHVVSLLICLQGKARLMPLYTEANQSCLPAQAKLHPSFTVGQKILTSRSTASSSGCAVHFQVAALRLAKTHDAVACMHDW